MSIKIMAEIWKYDFPHPIQLLLLALADHAKDDGTSIYPSKRLLSWKTGYSVRQVQRLIRVLENREILITQRAANSQFPTVYAMDLTKAEKKNEFVRRNSNVITFGMTNLKKAG
jgi:hypothetical protein